MSPEIIDDAGVPAALWSAGALPPHAATAMAGELLRAASTQSSDCGIDEIACVLLSRAARLTADRPSTRIRPGASDRRRSALAAEWLEVHAHEAVDLEAAARECGLSPYHFLRMFSACTGITPHQYLVSVRLRNAARRLIADDESATVIAYECGFGDLSNFIRTFRRAAGVPPAEFRRRSRQGGPPHASQFSPSARQR